MSRRGDLRSVLVFAVVFGWIVDASVARAQDVRPPPADQARPGEGVQEQAAPTAGKEPPKLTLSGYAEVFYQWNFGNPSNGITNFRGFDNRHNTFTISNVALDARYDDGGLAGRLALQIGHTPSTYYLSEPSRPGASGANATGPELWKYIQDAYLGYRFPLRRGLLLSAGIFLSPIGPETIPVRENWNWSRSNLFFGLPFYHTGVRLTYPFSDRWSVTLAGYNGWNSVVDNNDEKSLSVQAVYTRPDKLVLSLLYFGGVERNPGAPEGRPWRHVFDAHATWTLTPWLSLLGHFDTGFERTVFGTDAWVAGALAARLRIVDQLFFAIRGDIFHESAASNSLGSASRIFFPASWVTSGTATIDYRPHERTSFRLEYRHDHAADDMYFARVVAGDGVSTPYVPNREYQDTITIGATAWF